jgi:hypothetical protein
MRKKKDVLDFTTKIPLIERQRRLWGQSETIEIAMKQGNRLPDDYAEWLHRALKSIACGADANEVFDVLADQGVRRDGFLQEMQRKHANGYIAAATESGPGKKTTKKAIEAISEALPSKTKSTIRKNYNKLSTERQPTYSLGKK